MTPRGETGNDFGVRPTAEGSAPRLLDLFCGAGGCTKGYQRAGFYVVGVDLVHQPRYCGDEFIQADALTFPLDGFDAIHASPPCPRYSAGTPTGAREHHPDLVEIVRHRLQQAGVAWVVENVEGAPLQVVPSLLNDRAGVTLCGSMFDLRVRRHRLFESNVPLPQPDCRHARQGTPLSVTGTGYGGKHKGHNGTKPAGIAEAREVMGIPWMTIKELSNAIPPAYTEWIGLQLLAAVEAAA